MPILQPQKIRADNRRVERMTATESTEWVGLWSVSLGFVALIVASIVYFAGRDGIGASFILLASVAMIALLMRASANPNA
jgi:hypothetical protein